MSTLRRTTTKPRIVCPLTPSSASDTLLRAALAHCREHDFQLVVVWTIDPTAFRSPNAVTGGPGAWSPVGAWSDTLERARDEGLVAGTVFRFGEPTLALEEEREAFGAEMVFTAADIPIRRCRLCGWRDDGRAIHLCPALHIAPRSAPELSRAALG